MSIEKNRITNLLELRYDYMSARNVLNNWQKQSGVKEEINDFSDAQIRSLVVYLKENAPEAARTIGGLERLILNADADNSVVEPAPAACDDAPVADNNSVVEAETEVKADDNADVVADNADVAADNADVAADNADVAADNADAAAADNADVAADNADAAAADDAPAKEAGHKEGKKKNKGKK